MSNRHLVTDPYLKREKEAKLLKAAEINTKKELNTIIKEYEDSQKVNETLDKLSKNFSEVRDLMIEFDTIIISVKK
jgi:hypothetical protein